MRADLHQLRSLRLLVGDVIVSFTDVMRLVSQLANLTELRCACKNEPSTGSWLTTLLTPPHQLHQLQCIERLDFTLTAHQLQLLQSLPSLTRLVLWGEGVEVAALPLLSKLSPLISELLIRIISVGGTEDEAADRDEAGYLRASALLSQCHLPYYFSRFWHKNS